MLRANPTFSQVNLAAALEGANLPGGQFSLLAALRYIAEAQGMVNVAEKAELPRESLYKNLTEVIRKRGMTQGDGIDLLRRSTRIKGSPQARRYFLYQ